MRTIMRGLLIFFSIVFSGYTLFETTTGEQHCYDEGVSVIPSENGCWLVSGAYNCSGNPAHWKGCLVTFDSTGQVTSTVKDLPYNGIMRLTPDGNLVFAGGNHAGFSYDTAKIFKVTSSGTLLWEKNLFGGYCHHLLTDILPVNDGFLVTGIHAQNSCSSPVYDSYVAKLDTAGELVWKHVVTGAGNEQLHVVRMMKSGNIAAFGWTENKSSADDADYLLVKLDANGNEIWSKTFGDDSDNYGYGMDVTRDNGFILNGHSSGMEVMRVDAAGNLVWSKVLTESCGGRYFKAHVSLDGGYLFLGMEKSSPQCKSALIKTDNNGNILWKKNFDGVLRTVAERSPGRFALTGYRGYLPQLYAVGFDTTSRSYVEAERVDFNQEHVYSTEEDTAATLSGATSAEPKNHPILVYPNPSESIVNIEFENTEQQNFRVEIFDSNGRLVFSEITNAGRFIVGGETFPKGLYTYKLSGSGNVSSGKILFQ